MKSSGVEIAGYREIAYGTQYRLVRGTDKANLNVFHTGKTSVDGKDSGLKSFLNSHRPSGRRTKSRNTGSVSKSSKRPEANSRPRIGTDEAGKGDYFGPLVVVGVRVLGEDQDRRLREAGVKDSKDLSLSQASSVAAEAIEIVGLENICVKELEPREYERRRESASRNVNRLLGELNVEIVNELKSKVEVAVIDSFGSKAHSYIEPHVPEKIELEVRPKAEDDTAVAAASIFARARYLEAMELLSEKVGFELPRGSTHIWEAARRVVLQFGKEGLKDMAKIHFSITEKVLEGMPGGDKR